MCVTRKKRVTKNDRLLLRTGYRCHYCGTPITRQTMTRDHVVPRSRGGETKTDNLVPACGPCNRDKGNMSLDEYRKQVGVRQFWGEKYIPPDSAFERED